MTRCFLAFLTVVLALSLAGVTSAQTGLERPPLVQTLKQLAVSQPAKAKGIPVKYRPTVEKALKWIATQQQGDGHFEAAGGKYPVAMTAMAGMALLMEGSTIRNGK